MCGGTVRVGLVHRHAGGLSPRVRGNRRNYTPNILNIRSIPACAGEPPPCGTPAGNTRVYPRVCGGTTQGTARRRGRQGLSPRVRGNRDNDAQRRMDWAVYPRVCGGTLLRPSDLSPGGGLSPRVRGNPVLKGGQPFGDGSIPACAGEPSRRIWMWTTCRVYPRVCGGTHYRRHRSGQRQGLSPRVRGNQCAGAAPEHIPRSIPACAGEPSGGGLCRESRKVYPRVCGGTTSLGADGESVRGLSPRVRGNPPGVIQGIKGMGSIPACAGEPWRCGRGRR